MGPDAGVLIFFAIIILGWVVVFMVWRASNRRINAWREIIKKDDHAYFINQLGEKAFVKVLAVDRSRGRHIQVELMIGGKTSALWVDESDLYPAPTPTEDI